MKKRGFTLIELLAVIVILALIALIATPIVMNLISKARQKAAEDSTYGIVKAAENYYVNTLLDDTTSSITFECGQENSSGNKVCISISGKELEFNGTVPTSGKITITNEGEIIITETLRINNYSCVQENGKINCGTNERNVTFEGCLLIDGTPLTIGSKYSCNPGDGELRNFYVLEVNTDTVSLIMDRNIDHETMDDIDALDYLNTKTSNWRDVLVTLPTASQISAAVGHEWNENSGKNRLEWYYFESGTVQEPQSYTGEYTWLYGYTKLCKGCDPSLALSKDSEPGYWTSNSFNDPTYTYRYTWAICWDGTLYAISYVYDDEYAGVRPVITLSKTKVFN